FDVSGIEEGSLLAEQFMTSVRAVGIPGVNSLADAASKVDGGAFVITHFSDPATSQQLIGIDYGSGDNTYCAIFEAGGERPLFAIKDDELAAPTSAKPITTGMETFGAVLDRVTVH